MSDNPYLDSVPEELSKSDFVQQIKSSTRPFLLFYHVA